MSKLRIILITVLLCLTTLATAIAAPFEFSERWHPVRNGDKKDAIFRIDYPYVEVSEDGKLYKVYLLYKLAPSESYRLDGHTLSTVYTLVTMDFNTGKETSYPLLLATDNFEYTYNLNTNDAKPTVTKLSIKEKHYPETIAQLNAYHILATGNWRLLPNTNTGIDLNSIKLTAGADNTSAVYTYWLNTTPTKGDTIYTLTKYEFDTLKNTITILEQITYDRKYVLTVNATPTAIELPPEFTTVRNILIAQTPK